MKTNQLSRAVRRDSKKKDLLWSLMLALLALLFWIFYPEPPKLRTEFGYPPKKESYTYVSQYRKGRVVAEITNLPNLKRSESFGGMVPFPDGVKHLPVEVIAKGKAPEWVYVELEKTAVPEPGIFSLVALACTFLVFCRKRD